MAQEPTYKASDIVTRINMTIDVGGANIGFETYVMRDCRIEELKGAIGKLFDVAEFHRARFTLRALEAQLKTAENDFKRISGDRDVYMEDCRQQWFDGQRYGEVELSGSQAAHLDTLEKAVQSRVETIKELRHTINVTRGVLEGVQ
jgi:flagellar biosynthesis chaperone FliJ